LVQQALEHILRVIGIRAAEQPSRQVSRLRLSGGRLQVDRRQETRTSRISPCIYNLMRSFTPGLVLLEDGWGAAVNDSPTGMRLLLSVAPVEGQILEIQTADLTVGRAISLVEVCWTKPLAHDGQEGRYLVGCRLSFGPMRCEADFTWR
jgi:hypothetical protein